VECVIYPRNILQDYGQSLKDLLFFGLSLGCQRLKSGRTHCGARGGDALLSRSVTAGTSTVPTTFDRLREPARTSSDGDLMTEHVVATARTRVL